MSELISKMISQRLRISSYVGLTFGIIWGGFWYYCYFTAPRMPLPEQNRVYPLNAHGTLIYLNFAEHITLWIIPISFLLIGAVSAIMIKMHSYKNR
jgi:hypothetical protein